MANFPNKTVIIISGPTAVGKTAVAIDIAEHFKTEIISADSRQCFKELNIGVARPSHAELQQVKHHFIASHTIQEEMTAVTFEQFALTKTRELFGTKDWVVMVGGTGLYIKAFCEGLDDIPPIDPSIRERISAQYQDKGLNWLQEEIKEKDPVYYRSGEIQNPQRMMRALEVLESTGLSILQFQKAKKIKREFNTIQVALELPREELNERIDARVDKMMETGLLNEVKNLVSFKHLNALQTVGYKELFDHLEGKISLEEAVRQIKTHTHQYAKRQMTWFRKEKEITWFHPSRSNEIMNLLK